MSHRAARPSPEAQFRGIYNLATRRLEAAARQDELTEQLEGNRLYVECRAPHTVTLRRWEDGQFSITSGLIATTIENKRAVQRISVEYPYGKYFMAHLFEEIRTVDARGEWDGNGRLRPVHPEHSEHATVLEYLFKQIRLSL